MGGGLCQVRLGEGTIPAGGCPPIGVGGKLPGGGLYI